MFGYTEIVAVVVICYLIGMGVKNTPIDNKYIPTIVGICGAILGIVAYSMIPDLGVTNPLDAVATGIVSGLSATGVDQAVKQLTK